MPRQIEQRVHLMRAWRDLLEAELVKARSQGVDISNAELDFGFVRRGHRFRFEDRLISKGWQLNQVTLGDSFNWLSGFAPCRESTGNHERAKSLLPEHQRHPGAGRLARSSAVHINILVGWQSFELLGQTIWFQANGAGDA